MAISTATREEMGKEFTVLRIKQRLTSSRSNNLFSGNILGKRQAPVNNGNGNLLGNLNNNQGGNG